MGFMVGNENTGDSEASEASNAAETLKKLSFLKKTVSIGALIGVLAVFLVIGLTAGLLSAPYLGLVTMPSQDADSAPSGMSEEQLKEKAINYINKYFLNPQGVSASATSIQSVSDSFYKLDFDIIQDGEAVSSDILYISSDGKYLIGNLLDMDEQLPEPEGIQTSDVPEVELYIFSYCPAGSSSLDSFSETADFLKDYADFKVKFFSHTRGEYERQQNMLQECIQKVAPDKYWGYAKLFFEEVYQNCAYEESVDCDKEKSIELMSSTGINSEAVFTCVEENGENYYQQDIEDATNLQLSFSPSLVINGISFGSDFDRSPEGIKSLVCTAFNEVPEECNETLTFGGEVATGSC